MFNICNMYLHICKFVYPFTNLACRQAEENRRDELEEELQRRVLVDKNVSLSLNGKLLAGRLLPSRREDIDQVSVCSCSCLDLRGKYTNHEALLSSSTRQQTSPYIDSYRVDFEELVI